MREVRKVVVTGPLRGAVDGFSEYLTGLGYAPSSIELRLRLMAHVSRWLASEGLEASGLDASAVARFLVVRQATHTNLTGWRALVPLLTFLRSAGLVPEVAPSVPSKDPVERLLERWDGYLQRERGLQTSTARYYVALGRPFLVSRLRAGVVELASLAAGDVSAFVSERVPGLPVGTAKLTITALRSLLRFLHASGLIIEGLDRVVPARAGYRDSGVPRGLTPEQVAAVIAACDPETPVGRRDRAIVVILARLGFRAGELSRISLDDVDWRAGTVLVRGKGGYLDTVPLPPDVGEALAAHLLDPRSAAASGRSLFVGSVAPYRPLSSSGVIRVVRKAGQRAGLEGVGAHRLRHSVATATTNAGASLEETAQLLRHRSLASTTIYAKVDRVRLSGIVRPWPVIADRHDVPLGSGR